VCELHCCVSVPLQNVDVLFGLQTEFNMAYVLSVMDTVYEKWAEWKVSVLGITNCEKLIAFSKRKVSGICLSELSVNFKCLACMYVSYAHISIWGLAILNEHFMCFLVHPSKKSKESVPLNRLWPLPPYLQLLVVHSWIVYNQVFEVLLIKPSTNKRQINGGRVVLKLIGSWMDKKFATFYGSSILAGFIS
jgi:hypothetical protein